MSVVSHPAAKPVVPSDRNGAIPPLENGDRLTRAEFMRRYDAMPDVKAELIEGVVYLSSPVRHKYHGRPHSRPIGWLIHYEAGTPGVEGSDNSTILLDLDNTPQPDALLFVKPEHGGRVKINDDGYIKALRTWSPRSPRAAPVTICTTSSMPIVATGTRVRRLSRCRRSGRLVRASGRAIRSFIPLGRWPPAQHDLPGPLARRGCAGSRRPRRRFLAVVQQGLNSPEHAEFAARSAGVSGFVLVFERRIISATVDGLSRRRNHAMSRPAAPTLRCLHSTSTSLIIFIAKPRNLFLPIHPTELQWRSFRVNGSAFELRIFMTTTQAAPAATPKFDNHGQYSRTGILRYEMIFGEGLHQHGGRGHDRRPVHSPRLVAEARRPRARRGQRHRRRRLSSSQCLWRQGDRHRSGRRDGQYRARAHGRAEDERIGQNHPGRCPGDVVPRAVRRHLEPGCVHAHP